MSMFSGGIHGIVTLHAEASDMSTQSDLTRSFTALAKGMAWKDKEQVKAESLSRRALLWQNFGEVTR
jgi:hypothetical protein